MILHRCSKKKGEILSWSLTGVKGLKQGNSINSHLQISGTNNSQLLMLACASYFPHENIFHHQRRRRIFIMEPYPKRPTQLLGIKTK